ncbi:hypothetical protein ACIHIX_39590 [Streptomyces sp. NPDC051913]|uniref:hypothetical protein n=1 Tax=Streptomyces sp. NPDC051913 TaxID=3365676 RepID=UPI0037CFC014
MTAGKQRIGWSGKVWSAWASLRGRNCWYVVFWPEGEPYDDERAVVLRRTQYRWQAIHWLRHFGRGLRTPLMVTPHDNDPQYASRQPLYPYAHNPLGMDEKAVGPMLGTPDTRES